MPEELNLEIETAYTTIPEWQYESTSYMGFPASTFQKLDFKHLPEYQSNPTMFQKPKPKLTPNPPLTLWLRSLTQQLPQPIPQHLPGASNTAFFMVPNQQALLQPLAQTFRPTLPSSNFVFNPNSNMARNYPTNFAVHPAPQQLSIPPATGRMQNSTVDLGAFYQRAPGVTANSSYTQQVVQAAHGFVVPQLFPPSSMPSFNTHNAAAEARYSNHGAPMAWQPAPNQTENRTYEQRGLFTPMDWAADQRGLNSNVGGAA